jgi:hypothetical protein
MLSCLYRFEEHTEIEVADSPDTLATAKANARKALAALDAFDAIVEAYLASSGTTVARFGLEAGGQPEFVYRMRHKKDFRRSTMRRVLQHIAA